MSPKWFAEAFAVDVIAVQKGVPRIIKRLIDLASEVGRNGLFSERDSLALALQVGVLPIDLAEKT